MKRPVGVVATVGLLLVALSTAIVFQPGLADQFGYRSLLASLGNGYYLVAGIASLGFFYAIYVGMTWWLAGGVDQARPPAVEALPSSAIPGTELDDAVAELTGERGRAARPVEDRDRIRDRLVRDAVRTVARVENAPLDVARERVTEGEWTGNRYATAFVGGEGAPEPRWYQRIRDRALRRDPFARRVEATISAMRSLEETEP